MTEGFSQRDVSVVVVSWNTRELTLACLRSIVEEATRGELTCEAILVDNASSDGTIDAAASELPSIRIVSLDENAGFARAANRGVAESCSRYVLLLNSDAELPPNAISRLVSILEDRSDAGAVGAALVGAAGERQFSCGRFLNPVNQFAETMGISRILPFSWLRRSYRDDELKTDVVDVDWCVGACLMLRRAALEAVGDLDERFFMYSEDEDLCLRLRAAGWAVLHATSLAVRHRGGASASRALDRMRSAARASQNAFILKHFGAVRAWCFRTLMVIARLKPRRDDAQVGWGR